MHGILHHHRPAKKNHWACQLAFHIPLAIHNTTYILALFALSFCWRTMLLWLIYCRITSVSDTESLGHDPKRTFKKVRCLWLCQTNFCRWIKSVRKGRNWMYNLFNVFPIGQNSTSLEWIANAVRQIMIADFCRCLLICLFVLIRYPLPVCGSNFYIWDKTSIVDEVLSHRWSLVPLNMDLKLMIIMSTLFLLSL